MKKLILLLLGLAVSNVFGQSGAVSVSGITTVTTSIGATNINGTTFDGLTRAVTGISDYSGNTYAPVSSGTNVYIRRSGEDNSNNSSVTFASAGNGAMLSSYSTTLNTTLLSNNIYKSADNLFANGTAVNTGNIERVDFLFNGTVGIKADSLSNLAVFERGLAGQHDSFNITLITGWNSDTNTPTSFTKITTVATADFGAYNVNVDGTPNYSYNYNLFRYDNGNVTTNWTDDMETGNQGIGAVLLNLFGLGATNNQTIYGYSISASDSTTNPNVYANWNNSTYFPQNSGNGFDPYGVNGEVWQKHTPAPEPSTYGAILIGSSLLIFGWKRWKSAK